MREMLSKLMLDISKFYLKFTRKSVFDEFNQK